MSVDRIGRLPYRMRMFAGFLIISLLPLCILGVFSYTTYIRDLSEKMDDTMQSIANQTRDRVATVMTSIRDYYVNVPQNADVEWLAAEQNIPYDRYADVNAAIRQFRGALGIYEYVSGYTYINRVHDFVLTTNGMHRYSEMANKEEAEALILPENLLFQRMRWHNNMAKSNTQTVPRGTIDLRGYLLLLHLPMNGVDVDQALIINLNTVNLQRLLTRDLESFSVVVLDENREVFLKSSDTLAEYAMERYDELSKLSAPMLDSIDEGEAYRVAVAKSDAYNMMFVVGYNQQIIQAGADRILTLISVLAVTILALIILSWLGSRQLYRPVKQLASHFGNKDAQKGNDIEQITYEVKRLIGSNTAMEHVIGDQRDLLVKFFMTRLFRGELTNTQIEDQIRQLRLEPAACYCIMACRLPVGGTPDSVDENAVRIMFLDNLPSSIRAQLYTAPVNDLNAIVLLLGAESEAQLGQKVELVFGMLTAYAQSALSIALLVGVSSPIRSLAWCRTAFLESVEALKRDVPVEEAPMGDISYYANMHSDKNMIGVSYESQEQEIRLAVDECNRAKARRCLSEFIKRLPGWVNAKHQNALCINRFIISILSVLHDAGLSVDDVFAENEQTLFRQAGALYNAAELEKFIMHSVIDPSICALEAFREGATPINRIKDLVREANGNITIAECSDRLGYHTSYIWRIIKTHTGMSFAEYTAQAKVGAAMAMLMETDLSIAEIATELSYTNAQNFIRFFSKQTGTTPGKYRQQQKNGEEAENSPSDAPK